MKFIPAMVMIMAGFVLVGCDHHEPVAFSHTRLTLEQLAAANATRTKVGLPVIDGDWSFYRGMAGQEDWKRRGTDAMAKTVFLGSSGGVASEENYYYSGATYTDFEGLGFESLTLRYDYQSGRMGAEYIGTNAVTKAALERVSFYSHPSTNYADVMATVRAATAGWANPIK